MCLFLRDEVPSSRGQLLANLWCGRLRKPGSGEIDGNLLIGLFELIELFLVLDRIGHVSREEEPQEVYDLEANQLGDANRGSAGVRLLFQFNLSSRKSHVLFCFVL